MSFDSLQKTNSSHSCIRLTRTNFRMVVIVVFYLCSVKSSVITIISKRVKNQNTAKMLFAERESDHLMRRSNLNFNTPSLPLKPRAFELLKIGSFKFSPLESK